MFDRTLPVESDHDVLRLAREVMDLDRAQAGLGPDDPWWRSRLTWVLLLDDGARPLPVAIPVEGMPVDPDPEDVARFAESMGEVVRAAGAERVVILWERPGDGVARMQEADWAAGVAASGLPVLAQVLVTDEGFRLLDPAFEAIVAA